MSLFMRVLSVAPRGADAVGSLKVCRGGTAVGETREEGETLILGYTHYPYVFNEKSHSHFESDSAAVICLIAHYG